MEFFGGLITGSLITFFTLLLISANTERHVKAKDVFERGHMVQCLGKSGYYWECE